MTAFDPILSEQYIQDAFHSYLKSSLTQAKIEKLLDDELLSSAAGDLMITGPALCMYFAALRCTTNPPSVPLPRAPTKSGQPPLSMELSQDNCPPAFIPFLTTWSSRVPSIQNLAPEHQHDLARIICNLPPIGVPAEPSLNGIAADLRAVAIEISQRRTFQNRYQSDLQAALDAGFSGNGESSRVKKVASFVPPPSYDESDEDNSSRGSAPNSARASMESSPQYATHNLPPQSPSHLSPYYSEKGYQRSATSTGFPPSPTSPTSPISPSLLPPTSPGIEFIRETLYASIADVLDTHRSLRSLLRTDPPRAYFASVAFAILDVATHSMTPDGAVIGVMGKPLSLNDCPNELKPFMSELASIGKEAKIIEEDDDNVAMKAAQQGRDSGLGRMDRAKAMLENGLGWRDEGESNGRRSVEGRAVAFVNRINALSLGMTRLRAFKERQDDVFKVLAGIGN